MKEDLHVFALGCLFLALLFAFMFMVGSPAHSQTPPCARAADILSQLEKQYGETVTAGGVVGSELMVILTNKITGSWTILMRRLDGTACIVAGGTGFGIADPAPMKGNGL